MSDPGHAERPNLNPEQGSAEKLLRQVALDYWFGRQDYTTPDSNSQAQRIPINVYETTEDIVLAAPMPGIDADNVDIEVVGSTVTLRATLRGPGQADRKYLLHEWTYGPYERTVILPVEVDGEHANATHGNGILVVALPKASRAKTIRIPLNKAGSEENRHQGHSGHHSTREGLEGGADF
jgi:HSP20 family protein